MRIVNKLIASRKPLLNAYARSSHVLANVLLHILNHFDYLWFDIENLKQNKYSQRSENENEEKNFLQNKAILRIKFV